MASFKPIWASRCSSTSSTSHKVSSPEDSSASPSPAVHHPEWMLSCGPTRLRYGGFTSSTELVQSDFSVAFFFDDIGVERRWLEECVFEEGVGLVRVRVGGSTY